MPEDESGATDFAAWLDRQTTAAAKRIADIHTAAKARVSNESATDAGTPEDPAVIDGGVEERERNPAAAKPKDA
jgi:hypothetical protein